MPESRKRPVYALIVAAGVGARMGDGTPKQYRKLAGKSVLERSAEAFLNHAQVDKVCVVIHLDHEQFYQQAVGHLPLLPPAIGGDQRQDSVRNGVEQLYGNDIEDDALILVHDAARCMVDAATITRVIEALATTKAALPAIPVRDTLKKVDQHQNVAATVLRESLMQAQTPQGFHASVLRELHQKYAGKQLTDDAALAEADGIAVTCVDGSENNIKLTTEADWQQAEAQLNRAPEFRTGFGFDVHRLVAQENAKVWLCGVAIPHTHTLEGHSDADVGLHALVDALLGTIGAGDIGEHFPPTDPQWKGADSSDFVHHAVKLVAEAGGIITHADLTLICEAPKLTPHKPAMRAKAAGLVGVEETRANIKATTTEKLGSTGRGEGIAAQCVVTVKF